MKKRLILANPKTVIFDPKTGHRVPAEGIVVDTSQPFWRRRLKERSMIEAPPAAAEPVEPAPLPSPDKPRNLRHLMADQTPKA